MSSKGWVDYTFTRPDGTQLGKARYAIDESQIPGGLLMARPTAHCAVVCKIVRNFPFAPIGAAIDIYHTDPQGFSCCTYWFSPFPWQLKKFHGNFRF